MADTATPGTTTFTDTPEQEPDTNGGGSKYLRPDELLRKWSVALTNANDPGILGAMSKFAYDSKRIGEGAALHAKVTDLFARQKKEYGEQLDASAGLSGAFDKANAAYMQSVKIARIAFEGDTNAVSALLLTGARSKVVSAWTGHEST
jgi:hypothetical protein